MNHEIVFYVELETQTKSLILILYVNHCDFCVSGLTPSNEVQDSMDQKRKKKHF